MADVRRPETGTLALVVGPSGAGKDTLIAAARARLENDPRFVFVRRVVTRVAIPALEDHDSIDVATFDAAEREGAFALSWQAHGLKYGLPASINAALAEGRVVVANVSRQILARAAEAYPDLRVINIDVRPEIRARRLAARGRETEAEILARLARETAMPPLGTHAIQIDNSGALDEGIDKFVETLKDAAGA